MQLLCIVLTLALALHVAATGRKHKINHIKTAHVLEEKEKAIESVKQEAVQKFGENAASKFEQVKNKINLRRYFFFLKKK